MRNLKRVLSLALALVMVLGMMVITTSAADYTDADEITYTEAVDVMSAIGVITGDGGSFYPNRTLTREEGAAFICYMLMGKEAADKLTGSGNFADVAADRWSAGEIDYCANLGIILGYTDADGKQVFNPKGELTAVAFGRMLLGALGYDGTIEGYTGANWATAIASDMIDIGLDIDGVAMDAQLTREQAAQMAFQALTKTLVKYSTKGTSITIDGVAINTGASEATAVADESNENDTIATDGKLQFAEKYFSNLTKQTGEGYNEDAFGRPGYTWLIEDTTDIEVFIASKPIATYTAPAKAEDIAKALAKNLKAGTVDADDIEAATAYGTVVEVYADNNKQANKIVTIEETLGKVTKVTEAKGEAKRTVTVAGMTFVTEDFAKDDIVIYTAGSGKIQTMAAPETVVGTIESYNDTTVTIDGVKYNYGHDFILTEEFDDEQVFTLYSDGSIAAQGAVTEAAAAVSTDYVYVVKTEYQAYDAGDGSLLGNSTAKDPAAKAQVIFTDGTKAVIDLTITDVTTNPASPAYEVDVPDAEGAVTETALTDELNGGDIGYWFAYTVAEDGTYTLTALDGKYAAVEADLALVKGQMEVVAGKYTTTETKINSISAKGVVTTKVGFEQATLTGKVLVTYAKNATTATALYAVNQADATVAPDTTIYYAVKAGNTVKGGTEWTFAAKGEQVTYVIKAAEVRELSEGGYYTLTAGTGTDAGLYLVDDEAVSTATALVSLISGDKVAFSDGTIKTLAEKVNVYNIDETAEVVGEVKALEVGDVIDYTVNGDGEITNIWVYGVEGTVEVEDDEGLAAAIANEPTGITIVLAEGDYVGGYQFSKDIKLVADGAVTMTAVDQCVVILNHAANFTAEGIKFVVKDATTRDFYGIKAFKTTGKVVIKDCAFAVIGGTDNTDCNGNGVSVEGVTGTVSVLDCTFTGLERAVHFSKGETTKVWKDVVTVEGNHFDTCAAAIRVSTAGVGDAAAQTALKAALLADNTGLQATNDAADNYIKIAD